MPLIPHARIPITPEDTFAMASREVHFMAAILVVSASLVGDQALHEILWPRVKSLFAEVAVMGSHVSVDVIEGLILLSCKFKAILQVAEVNDTHARIPAKHGLRPRIRM